MWKKIKTWFENFLPSDTEFGKNKLVYKTMERHMASIIKLKLEEEGIRVFILNKMDSAYNNFGSIELYVNEEDVVRAKYIIDKPYE